MKREERFARLSFFENLIEQVKIYLQFLRLLSPGPPPGPVHRPVQKKKNFRPSGVLGGGSWQQTVEVGNIFISV